MKSNSPSACWSCLWFSPAPSPRVIRAPGTTQSCAVTLLAIQVGAGAIVIERIQKRTPVLSCIHIDYIFICGSKPGTQFFPTEHEQNRLPDYHGGQPTKALGWVLTHKHISYRRGLLFKVTAISTHCKRSPHHDHDPLKGMAERQGWQRPADIVDLSRRRLTQAFDGHCGVLDGIPS